MDPACRQVFCLLANYARTCVRERVCDNRTGHTCDNFLNSREAAQPCWRVLEEVFSHDDVMEEADIASIFDLQALLIEAS